MTAELAVVVPAYNEEASIERTVEQLQQVLRSEGISHEIVVVDDGSSDRTAELASGLDVSLVVHPRNRGYGAALRTGIRAAQAPYIGIVDADGTYPIDRLPDLYRTAVQSGYDHVIGSRNGEQVHDSPGRWVARRVLKLLAFMATGRWIDDLNSGLRVFTRETALRHWTLYPDGFSFTTTITIASLQSGASVCFEPISYFSREGKSHIRPVRDFFRFTSIIVRVSFIYAPLRFFLVPGVLMFVGGIVLGLVQIVDDKNLSDSAVITTLIGLQLLLTGLIAESIGRLHRRPLQL